MHHRKGPAWWPKEMKMSTIVGTWSPSQWSEQRGRGGGRQTDTRTPKSTPALYAQTPELVLNPLPAPLPLPRAQRQPDRRWRFEKLWVQNFKSASSLARGTPAAFASASSSSHTTSWAAHTASSCIILGALRRHQLLLPRPSLSRSKKHPKLLGHLLMWFKLKHLPSQQEGVQGLAWT